MNTVKHNPKKRRLNIPSRTDQLSDVRDFVSGAAREFGFRDDDVNNIALAVDEACTNIIKHAYAYAADKTIQVSIVMNDAEFEISIVDTGRHFDPEKVQIPDMKEYLSHYKRGGLGMYLMKKLMDEVHYTMHADKNIVRLVKYLH